MVTDFNSVRYMRLLPEERAIGENRHGMYRLNKYAELGGSSLFGMKCLCRDLVDLYSNVSEAVVNVVDWGTEGAL